MQATAPAPSADSDIRVYVNAPPSVGADALRDITARLRTTGYAVNDPAGVGFVISQSHVRYYHAQDAVAAERLAGQIDGPARDFTGFRPQPAVGTLEVWIAGTVPASAAPPPQVAAAAPAPAPVVTQPAPREIVIAPSAAPRRGFFATISSWTTPRDVPRGNSSGRAGSGTAQQSQPAAPAASPPPPVQGSQPATNTPNDSSGTGGNGAGVPAGGGGNGGNPENGPDNSPANTSDSGGGNASPGGGDAGPGNGPGNSGGNASDRARGGGSNGRGNDDRGSGDGGDGNGDGAGNGD